MIKSSFKIFRLSVKENPVVLRKLAVVILGEILSVFLLYKLNGVYGDLYKAIQVYDIPTIWKSVGIFSAIAGVLVVVGGYLGAYINALAFEVRRGLTIRAFNMLEIEEIKNIEFIDQKIQEDLNKFAINSCDFWTAIFKAALKLPVFIGVISTLTHWYIGAIIVATVLAGTVATKLVSNRLVDLQAQQESNEAEYRQTLLMSDFATIYYTFYEINKRLKLLSFTQSGLSQGFALLPFILLLPLYITKSLDMGGFFQSVNALGKIIDSLSILIDSRQIMVNIQSTIKRIEFLIK